ncbi:RNA-binding protein 26-like isoform X2 [Ornithodoros turicata]|uniref:RNA-binding protein 26-like isoform X2 n=1 Tax=Ornithodoros turicata TaxID=34597 RepID=UPI0031389550
MIIENSEALKSWLTSCLEHMCDADPAALAKYVMALVKKDKSEKELKDICLDQLDVFLQKETKPFVDMLFETLSTKSYLHSRGPRAPVQQPPQPPPPPVAAPLPPLPPHAPPLAKIAPIVASPPPALPSHREIPPGSEASGMPGQMPEAPALGAGAKSEAAPRKEEGTAEDEKDISRSGHRKSRSRSRSPVGGRSRNRTRSRSREDERRGSRRFSGDRRRRANDRGRRRYADVGGRHRDGRGRWGSSDERSSGRSAGARERSHSGRRSWSGSPSRSASRSRSRSPHRSRNRSRGEKGAAAGNDASRGETRGSNAPHTTTPGSAPAAEAPVAKGTEGSHGDTDYRPGAGQAPLLPGGGGGDAAPASFHPTPKMSKRCRDYDERGYCMRGDYCPFDHGKDPVVVEDVSMLRFGLSGPPPPTSQPGPPIQQGPLPMPHLPHTGLPPPLTTMEPPLMPPAEPYNPEAPGMERPLRLPQAPPYWGHPPVRGAPPPVFHPPRPHRELIGVPTVGGAPADLSQPPPPTPGRTVIDPHHLPPGLPPPPPPPGAPPMEGAVPMHEDPSMQGNPPRPMAPSNMMVGNGMHMRQHGRGGQHHRGMREYGRGMGRGANSAHYERCELEVRKVPRNLNNITQLNNHFSRFGNIVNLQVCYEGDPEAALIRFANHAQANAAYRCTEAVLNNRFIKVFWHNKDRQNEQATTAPGTPPTGGATVANGNSAPQAESAAAAAAAPAATGADGEATSTSPGKSVKERLGTPATSAPPGVEKSVVYSAAAGNLSRTVFNPAALKKNNVINTAVPRKTKEEQKKEIIKKKVEVQGQRQKLLEKHLQQNKLLLGKLEKCKTDKEKTQIKQTLEALRVIIEKLRVDIKKATSEMMVSRTAAGGQAAASRTRPTEVRKASVLTAERELLDAEMDLYNKIHRGDDTTDLKKKVYELKQQARALGLLGQWRGRGGAARRGGAVLRGRGLMSARSRLNVIDHRPRKVFVKGMDGGDKENLQAHFAQYGEVEGVEPASSGLVITFKTRKDAELGVSQGSEFKNRPLQWAWFKEPARMPSTGDVSETANVNDDDLAVDDEHSNLLLEEDLLLVDDEDEEDSEARSWRR